MSAHNPQANRRTDHERYPLQANQNCQVSTRVLLDSGSPPTCETCGSTIEMKARHKCLTVRGDAGSLDEFVFCDEACLAGRATRD